MKKNFRNQVRFHSYTEKIFMNLVVKVINQKVTVFNKNFHTKKVKVMTDNPDNKNITVINLKDIDFILHLIYKTNLNFKSK